MAKTLLVAGSSGVNGQAVAAHFAGLGGWEVRTLSRGESGRYEGVAHTIADLLQPDDVAAKAGDFAGVTHVFYAALKPNADARVEADENAMMFETLIDAVARAGALERVIFLQGGKVYGAHLGVYKTPAREDDSRHFPPNLYFRHEDHAREASRQAGWKWTALRPDIVIGHSVGSAMNLGNLIGVYGSLCRELGCAMQFPGTAAAYDVLVNVTDAEIVAKAAEWACENSADGAFNITNGDVFRWRHVWPKLVASFGLEVGEPQPISLQTRLQAMSGAWDALVEREGLAKHGVLDLSTGSFGDFIFKVERDAIFDVTKARQAGFGAMTRRSDESLLAHLDAMRARKLIPS